MNVDTFIRQIQDMQQRLGQIRGRTNEAPTQQQIRPKVTNFQAASVDNPAPTLTLTQQQLEIMVAAFQELGTTLEELQTTNEELSSSGVPYAICGMSTDISDRKKAEQALQQLNQELEERVKERTESLEQSNQQLLSKIAEHQQTLEALGQSEQRFSQLVANVPGIIYQFLRRPDGSMSFPYISSGCREIFELEPEVIQDDAMALIKLIHPDDSVSFEESVVTSIATLQPWKWEGRFLTASGKLIWLSGASRPQQQANGDILHEHRSDGL